MSRFKISPDFTIKDIKKIRKSNAKRLKRIGYEAYEKEMIKIREEFLRLVPSAKLVKIEDIV